MEEQLISFETAKLAKEKGFPQTLFNTSWYNELGTKNGRTDLNKQGKTYNGVHNSYSLFVPKEYKDEFKIESFSAPTQSLLQKWLREAHNISLFIDCIGVDKNVYYYGIYYINNGEEDYVEQEGQFIYEEALEKGLQEALKLI